MDLSNLSASELRNLQEQVKRELKKRESQDLQKAKDEILAIAQRVGLPLKELIASNSRGKGGTVAARFRNPGDSGQQWTGRGRQPKWVKDWVDSGKSIDDLRI
ncbi:H-NS histone family protein [Pseudoduganella lutea]|uniref:H-NS histone family protein n=1 Tax=Pseudoduganella lutea TaxID=321985 RepID=A0A4V0Z3S8_9BURK|nr:H-NS histone family protein [Pseudoduganella lutea]QBE64493.1 H-NS histone family protein [Pseudoduganella lutea]